MTDRSLPKADDCERGLLCSFLRSPKETGAFCKEKGIYPGHFYSQRHAIIYEWMQWLHDDNEPIDIITVTQAIRDANLLDAAGGPAYITELFTFLPTATNAAYYASIVIEKYLLREIIKGCTEYASRSYEEQDAVPELVEGVEKLATRLVGITRGQCGPRVYTRDLMREILEEFKRGDTQAMFGRRTGFDHLDERIGGFLAGDLVVIAAESSGGKSALALQIEDYWSNAHKVRVTDFTFEMTKKQKAKRLLQLRSRINLRDALRRGMELGDTTVSTLERTVSEALHTPEFIDDKSLMDITACCSELRRMNMQSQVGMAVLDYDLLIRGEQGERGEREVASIAKCWKNVAMEIGCVGVLLSQVTKDSHGNTKMKWSEAKRDFANVLLEISDLDDGGKSVTVRKNRDGERFRSVHFDFDGPTTRFTERPTQPE